jgi:alanyl-tRNA synthetase
LATGLLVIISKRSHQLGLGTLTEVIKFKRKFIRFCIRRNRRERSIDQEAWDIWKELMMKTALFLNKKDNLEMGDQGPCGPCSEIHVDFVLMLKRL